MNLEKVVFSFFIILALTLNFSFVYGEIDNPATESTRKRPDFGANFTVR